MKNELVWDASDIIIENGRQEKNRFDRMEPSENKRIQTGKMKNKLFSRSKS